MPPLLNADVDASTLEYSFQDSLHKMDLSENDDMEGNYQNGSQKHQNHTKTSNYSSILPCNSITSNTSQEMRKHNNHTACTYATKYCSANAKNNFAEENKEDRDQSQLREVVEQHGEEWNYFNQGSNVYFGNIRGLENGRINKGCATLRIGRNIAEIIYRREFGGRMRMPYFEIHESLNKGKGFARG